MASSHCLLILCLHVHPTSCSRTSSLCSLPTISSITFLICNSWVNSVFFYLFQGQQLLWNWTCFFPLYTSSSETPGTTETPAIKIPVINTRRHKYLHHTQTGKATLGHFLLKSTGLEYARIEWGVMSVLKKWFLLDRISTLRLPQLNLFTFRSKCVKYPCLWRTG